MACHVFDFDKTLTNGDTLVGFYRAVHGTGGVFFLKRLVLFLAALSYKVGVISNDGLKKTGVWLFLSGCSREQVDQKSRAYARGIKLNDFYSGIYLRIPESERIVVSASFEEYLKHVFPGDTVVGSVLAYEHGKVAGLKRNMYGRRKQIALQERAIRVDTCYTDSEVSDAGILQMARRQVVVKEGKIVREQFVEDA